MRGLVCQFINLYMLVILARIVLSWFPPSPGGGALATITGFVFRATEPLLGPLRRVIPPVRIGGMALDLSVTVVLLGWYMVLAPIICG